MSETVSLSREIYVPRELVFDAWTSGEHLPGWYPPDGSETTSIRVEPAMDGRFELAWSTPEGRTVREAGKFATIERPAGFDCLLLSPDGDRRVKETRLEVRLVDLTDACRVELRQHDVPDGDADRRRREWEDRLERLEAYFSII